MYRHLTQTLNQPTQIHTQNQTLTSNVFSLRQRQRHNTQTQHCLLSLPLISACSPPNGERAFLLEDKKANSVLFVRIILACSLFCLGIKNKILFCLLSLVSVSRSNTSYKRRATMNKWSASDPPAEIHVISCLGKMTIAWQLLVLQGHTGT